MNYLEFLQKRELIHKNTQTFNESFKNSEVDKAHDLMLSIFKKKISSRVFQWDWLDTTIDGKEMRSIYFINLQDSNSPVVWSLNYLIEGDSSSVYSISIFDIETSKKFLWSNNNRFKAKLEIDTLGTSVAYFLPLINHIVKTGDFSISIDNAKKEMETMFTKNEARYYDFGALKYKVFENLTNENISDMFFINQGYEMVLDEANQAQEYRWKKKQERDNAYQQYSTTKSAIDKQNWQNLTKEYQDVLNAIRGGAQTIEDIKLALKKNVTVETPQNNSNQDKLDTAKEEYLKDPKQAFKEMQVYVKTVIKGLQPGVILCGAPGIGKTYRVLQQLKASNYNDGHNMEIIKGKCTPRQLYLSLYNYNKKGEIVVIDDADALVGPKAPEDCINMLKAALDSTGSDEGRKVSYRVTGSILDDEGQEIPKTMYYNGSVIVITNYSVGQLDSALRGRTFIQSLDFSTNQLLNIIEELLPNIDPTKLTDTAKRKALDYLKELSENGEEMEISIRTFSTCARLFTVCEDDIDMSDDDVKSMIKEQMNNQFARGGKKF